MSAFDKLDVGLILALRAFEESGSAPADDGISVTLRFEGDLAEIEALGFETTFVEDQGEARGVIRFRDAGAVSSHPNVLWIAAGESRRPCLDIATPDGVVRSAAAGDVGTTGLWHVPDDGGTLPADASAGKGVIVAVIDTGIDYTHPMFMSQLTPSPKTRILRIWDQGLEPSELTECPAASLLSSGGTYGVQFNQKQINDALEPGTKALPHRDCYGHGTHVAGIAAGGPLFAKGGNAKIVGVAPEADIIAVKLFDVPDEIQYRTATGFGVKVSQDDRVRDAVMYCLRIARGDDPEISKRPVVINMSLGVDALPGDGLDDIAVWIDRVLDPTKQPGTDNFPTGAIVVKSMGNEGDDKQRMLAKITVPAAGTITVPLELVDGRKGVSRARRNCKRRPYAPAIPVHLWYRRDPAVAVTFAWRVPGQAAPGMPIGLTPLLTEGFKFKVGPPDKAESVPHSPKVHRVVVSHVAPPAVAHPNGLPDVERNHFRFAVEPKKVGGTVSYMTGRYELVIVAPKDTVLFLQCSKEIWGNEHVVLFRVADEMLAGVTILKTHTSADPLGQHAISVANYNDANGRSSDPAFHHIATSSSQGPLRDYSNPPRQVPFVDKPDLAAPGQDIRSAASKHRGKLLDEVRTRLWKSGVRFDDSSGTSMAAPFVAGVVALMLQKKPALNTTEVRLALQLAALLRPGAGPGVAKAFGAGLVHGLESYKKA